MYKMDAKYENKTSQIMANKLICFNHAYCDLHTQTSNNAKCGPNAPFCYKIWIILILHLYINHTVFNFPVFLSLGFYFWACSV